MADLSPEFASEIQKLDANYASNPGRFFVPLASKWRDAGDVARAERILRENISKFPGLSAHVLLGRCLADRGAFPEAANEFHYVLSIDSQNLIALRTLAEMAAAGGRRGEAERWYNELLAVDPMNAEARAALAQLARAGTAPAETAEPAPPGWGDVSDDAGLGAVGGDSDAGGEFGMIDLDVPDASPADASGVAADEPADLGAWGDLTLDASPAPEPASAASAGGDLDGFGFVDLDAEPASADASPAWTDVDARQDVGESAAADLGDLPLLDDGMIDAPLAGADLPFIDSDPTVDDGGFGSLASEPGAGFGFGEPAPAAAREVDHVFHEADGHDAEAEMVTETMAELYASQGLLAQAADVYRELIGQRGQEPGLVRRLGEIEAQIAGEPVQAAPRDGSAGAPDWLESVDAFARGGGEPERAELDIDGGLPALDLTPASSDAFSFGTQADASDFGAEPDAAEFSIAEPAPSAFSAVEPAAPDASADPFADSFSAGFDGAAEPVTADADADSADWMEPVSADAGSGSADWADAFAADAETATPADAGAGSGSADWADAFAADAGAEPLSADVGGADDRQAWEAPTVAETEPVGFDILVVADEDGGEVAAPPEVVADVSADWAIAAAPLDDDDDEEEAPMAAAASAYTPPAPGGRTMRGYFSSLLTWQPVPEEAPTYEISASGGTLTIEAAAPESAEALQTDDAPFADVSSADTPSAEVPSFDDVPSAAAPSFEAPAGDVTPSFDAEPAAPVADEEPAPWEAAAPEPAFPAAPEIPTFQAPSFQPPAFTEPAAPVAGDDEPWAAASAEDEPWATPGESAPAASAEPAPGDLPLLDLEEPWAETPAAPAQPVDIGSFELSEDAAPAPSAEYTPPAEPAASASTEPASDGADAQAEELLPWEVPAEPAAAAPQAPAASDAGGGFSFEDFFSGTPSASAAPSSGASAPMAEPRQPETPAFIPSFAEPTPPPVFEAPAPPPAPAAPPAAAAPQAGGQDEDDEDLESFQAWLQSLKR